MRNLTFILILLSFGELFTQVSNKEFKDASKNANASYFEGFYKQAYPNYLIMEQAYPEDAIIKFRLGVCERELFMFEQSIKSFEKSIALGYQGEDVYYQKGKTMQYAHDFEQAASDYEMYLSLLKEDADYYDYAEEKAKALAHLEECKVGKALKENAYVIELNHLDSHINSEYPDYAPLISKKEDVLIFTSRKPADEKSRRDMTGHYHEHIYISRREGDSWGDATQIEEFKHFKNIASVALSPDGTHLILFANNKILGHGLFMSNLQGVGDTAKWSKPVNLGEHINRASYEPSATISEDNKTIIFSSDRAGGYGGLDLYKATQDSTGDWSIIQNLGDVVNTSKDEDSPFLQDDVLFFSSKGHVGMGGYDLFSSVYLFDEWLEPINFGYPINSARDDFHFSWSEQGRRAYFSSVRSDTRGESDIYVIVRPADDPDMIYVKGTVTDEISDEPIAGAQVSLVDSLGNVINEYETDSLGNYKLMAKMGETYKLNVVADQVDKTSFDVAIPEQSAYFEVTNNMQVKQFAQVDSVNVSDSVSQNENDILAEVNFKGLEIYFGFNKTTFEASNSDQLSSIIDYVNQNDIMLVLTGHTDKVGSHAYNDVLSKKRASRVANYLISNGLSQAKLLVKGFGKRKLKYNSDDKNRRVEFDLNLENLE